MIGITKCERNFELYIDWLNYFNVNYLVLDYKDRNYIENLKKIKGLILSGGIDIYPELYNDWETKEDTGKYNTDRDGFEYKLIEYSINNNIPILGICRGCQLINVFFNGSLIYDIPSIRKVDHDRIDDNTMRIHNVNVFERSLLYNSVLSLNGNVTSSHHQSVDRLGEGLMVSAKADDGIIEAIEYANNSNKPFLLGIQWHPERFSNFEDAFSKNILLSFVNSIS